MRIPRAHSISLDFCLFGPIRVTHCANRRSTRLKRRRLEGRNQAALRVELFLRFLAADLAWRESAAWLAVFLGSRFSACRRALDRLLDDFFVLVWEDCPLL